MDDKYKIMTLKYLYELLDLKQYEKKLENNNLDSIITGFNDFKYFTLLSNGNISTFTEEERQEFLSFDKYSIEEMLSNDEISNKIISFIKRTFQKFYFSDTKGEYIQYNQDTGLQIVPDDAFALGINYRIKYEDYSDEKSFEISKIIAQIINDIQFNKSKEKGLKVGVIENKGLALDNNFLVR